MNIFILDKDPKQAAVQQCDKHIVKMVLESAQMLSTAHRLLDGTLTRRPSKSGKTMSKYYALSNDFMERNLYKAVHFNHPCTVWTMESLHNYHWHYNHFTALAEEYEYRYNKEHKSWSLLSIPLSLAPANIPTVPQTPFKLAMGSNPECMDPEDPVGSYRKFYKTKQARFSMDWTNRSVPNWFQQAI